MSEKKPSNDQLKAWNLICEPEAADLRNLDETIAMVVRSSALPVKRVLVSKKGEEEEEEEGLVEMS